MASKSNPATRKRVEMEPDNIQSGEANRNRQSAPEFKVGDIVMLDARNHRPSRANYSLENKHLVPFEVSQSDSRLSLRTRTTL